MGANIRGLAYCTTCCGEGVINKLEYIDSSKNEDKVIEWLEVNVNKNDEFYFRPGKMIDNYIHCHLKADDTHLCTFYRDVIEKLLEG